MLTRHLFSKGAPIHGTLKCKGRASVFKPLGLNLDTTVHEKCLPAFDIVMITYNIYIVIRETGQFSSKGIINDFIGNLNRLTVSRRFTEQAV